MEASEAELCIGSRWRQQRQMEQTEVLEADGADGIVGSKQSRQSCQSGQRCQRWTKWMDLIRTMVYLRPSGDRLGGQAVMEHYNRDSENGVETSFGSGENGDGGKNRGDKADIGRMEKKAKETEKKTEVEALYQNHCNTCQMDDRMILYFLYMKMKKKQDSEQKQELVH
jgi:hypothetical protein